VRKSALFTSVTAAVVSLAGGAAAVSGGAHRMPQERPELHIQDGAGPERTVSLSFDRGFAAVRAPLLDSLGWTSETHGDVLEMTGPDATIVRIRTGTPFFRWNETVLQLADAPYRDDGTIYLPLQILSDFLPDRLPDRYAFDGASTTLRWVGPSVSPSTNGGVTLLPDDGVRVVIIDPGHGGVDPGTIGRGNVREKTVALHIAEHLAADLEKVPGLEVHLTRHTDTLVALWDRGQIATRLKGNRPGVFISIHANSAPSGTSIRGFETYFLSEARTDHERRVAAIENAPLGVDTTSGKGSNGGDLDFILRDMKNLDTQHWSSLLAEMVQHQLDQVHPGPDRGVKQAPLAVITNALMPAVLVEVGYLSNPAEARLLTQASFQEKAAEAIAKAVQDFFGRYPPGGGNPGGTGRERS
jgi:N-acetylmuramoyl-L-alanine amidase